MSESSLREMKKLWHFLLALPFCLALASHEVLEEVITQIEVPVRTFRNNAQRSDLYVHDFELYEDGKRQHIEAGFLVKNGYILGGDRKSPISPDTRRNFFLFSEIAQFTEEIKGILEFFTGKILRPGDNLFVVTSRDTYRLKRQALDTLPKDVLLKQLEMIIRKNALSANPDYASLITDLKETANAIADFDKESEYRSPSLDALITRYISLLRHTIEKRQVKEKRYLDLIDVLSLQEGQKYAFLFYQREAIPRIKPEILEDWLSLHRQRQNVIHYLAYIPEFCSRDLIFRSERLSQMLSHHSIMIHFLFFDIFGEENLSPMQRESTAALCERFNRISGMTGGYTDCSLDPARMMRKITDSLNDYYLLVYTPSSYPGDGRFKTIDVKIKGNEYRIAHRSGYFSD